MRATSKVIMGATLVMVVCLAIVLGLVLVLLAELYCTLLLRRKRHRLSSDLTTTTTFHSAVVATSPAINDNSSSPQLSAQPNHSPSLPLASYYAQGVLQAPRSFLYPAISCKEDKVSDAIHRKSQLHHHVLDVHSNRSPQQIGLLSASPSSTSFAASSPHQVRATDVCNEKSCNDAEHLVYISNPIYANDASRVDTPFETPDSSPSRLETGDGSSVDENEEEEETAQPCQPSTSSCPHSPITTPPLTPMKKLPAEACSVSLRDARSLGTSGSDSVSDHNGLSSSSSGSPCTSPSW